MSKVRDSSRREKEDAFRADGWGTASGWKDVLARWPEGRRARRSGGMNKMGPW